MEATLRYSVRNHEMLHLKKIPIYEEKYTAHSTILPAQDALNDVVASYELTKLAHTWTSNFSTQNFVRLRRIRLLKGLPPQEILKAWEDYNAAKNITTEIYCKLYIIYLLEVINEIQFFKMKYLFCR